MPTILTDHEAIRQWTESRSGLPMMEDLPAPGAGDQTLLQLTFGQHALNADGNEGPDRPLGFQLVGWDEWLAEFDRQNLALKVQSDQPGGSNDFEFVARSGEGETTDAAQKPAAQAVTPPNWSGLR